MRVAAKKSKALIHVACANAFHRSCRMSSSSTRSRENPSTNPLKVITTSSNSSVRLFTTQCEPAAVLLKNSCDHRAGMRQDNHLMPPSGAPTASQKAADRTLSENKTAAGAFQAAGNKPSFFMSVVSCSTHQMYILFYIM